jgi:hypothetical protein
MADPGFQHRVLPKINCIQRYKKYIISTHIYQYILDFSIKNRPPGYSQEYRGINAGSAPDSTKKMSIWAKDVHATCLIYLFAFG